MRKLLRLVAGVVLAGTALTGQGALAQDTGTMIVGGTEISVGGGFATLGLPDVRFGVLKSDSHDVTVHRFSNDDNFGSEFGPSITGSVVIPWTGPTALAFTGFFSNIDADNTVHCSSSGSTSCALVDPTGTRIDRADQIKEATSRDVDNWGVQLEGRYQLGGPIMAPGLLRSTYLAIGADTRAINQDMSIRNTSTDFPGSVIRYNETLDTQYYGGYLAIGGEYSIFPGLNSSWGLRSGFNAHVGIYDAQTDYGGTYKASFVGSPTATTRLSLSDDQAVVIAGLTFETRKQFGPRTSLSLLSEYDWYSSVPEMRYSNGYNTRTTIDDDSVLATRTTFRVNIGLGPSQLYAPPPPGAEPLK
ncbi:hypothetical protein [Methyloceanibacter sp.]|uniref:hypothetical protein n=1 Tax=Methyloceanibacter sp. TaxID=1965321 RepID=UPI003D6D5CED